MPRYLYDVYRRRSPGLRKLNDSTWIGYLWARGEIEATFRGAMVGSRNRYASGQFVAVVRCTDIDGEPITKCEK